MEISFVEPGTAPKIVKIIYGSNLNQQVKNVDIYDDLALSTFLVWKSPETIVALYEKVSHISVVIRSAAMRYLPIILQVPNSTKYKVLSIWYLCRNQPRPQN